MKFEREFVIQAPTAAAANEKLEEAVRNVEFDADVSSQGTCEFEDEPVQCPECHGLGVCNPDEETEHICSRCDGDRWIPFVAGMVKS